MNQNADIYTSVRSLADDLAAAGNEEEAMAIGDALEGGATGTEILMALRWNLEKLISAQPLLCEDLRSRSFTLSQEIRGLER